MLRPNKKAKKIAAQVMKLSQQYGEDVETISFEERSSPSKVQKEEQITDITSFLGNQTR